MRATRKIPSGATVADASASTGTAEDAASVSQVLKGNCTLRTTAATRNTMPSTRIARGPAPATLLWSVAITPCETTSNEKGSATVCPDGGVSSDEKTPNLIHAKTTPRGSAMSPAVTMTIARIALRTGSARCHDSVSRTYRLADAPTHMINESKRLGLSTKPVVQNASTDDPQKNRR